MEALLDDRGVQTLGGDRHPGLCLGPLNEGGAQIVLQTQGLGGEPHWVVANLANAGFAGDLVDALDNLEHGLAAFQDVHGRDAQVVGHTDGCRVAARPANVNAESDRLVDGRRCARSPRRATACGGVRL
jgi:hypothetical protein